MDLSYELRRNLLRESAPSIDFSRSRYDLDANYSALEARAQRYADDLGASQHRLDEGTIIQKYSFIIQLQ